MAKDRICSNLIKKSGGILMEEQAIYKLSNPVRNRDYYVYFTDNENNWCFNPERILEFKSVTVRATSREDAVDRGRQRAKELGIDTNKWLVCSVVEVAE